MKTFYGWAACVGLSACLLGMAGCEDQAGNGAGGGVDVEVNKTPDLNPRTDDDVDVEVE